MKGQDFPWDYKLQKLFSERDERRSAPTDQGGGSGGRALSSCTGTRLSPRDTRRASHTLPTGDARAQIDRVHNHNSRATTGPTPCRPGAAPQQRYEHKVKSRNNKAT
jgi:hypothetical protein